MAPVSHHARVVATYLVALLVGVGVSIAVHQHAGHAMVLLAIGGTVTTLVIWVVSRWYNNSSFFDPYWSVIPPLYAITLWPIARDGVPDARRWLVLGLLGLWSVRLTANWALGWRGLDHEDWRYVQLREQWGRRFWLVDLLGIHLFPTALVTLGSLPLYPALVTGTRPLGLLDGLAALVMLGGVGVEGLADHQMRAFHRSSPPAGAVLDRGLWGWSRHPNYVGEMGMWLGLFLFALAADSSAWWTGVGWLSMVALFRFVSVPMMEARQAAKRSGWSDYAARVPRFLGPVRRA